MRTRHEHTGEDLAALTRLLHDLTEDMPPTRRQRLKDHLIAEIRPSEAGPSPAPGRARVSILRGRAHGRARVILAAGVGVVAVATAVTAIIITSQGGPSLPPASKGAVQLLAKVADAAARQPTVRVRDSQYMYAEVKNTFWSLPGNLEPFIRKGLLPRYLRLRLEKLRPHKSTSQIWMPVSDVCREGLMRTEPGGGQGAKFDAREPGVRCPNIGGLNDATYRLLQTLPTDPHALLAVIYQVERGHGPSADQEAFVTIGDLLRDKIAPPKVTAALYRAAALIPGVTLVPNATDAIGRHGVAVAQTADGIRTELIFSKTSLRLIGERTILASIGMSTSATAIIRQAFVNHLGQVPASTDNSAA
jgi:hypothetical protein